MKKITLLAALLVILSIPVLNSSNSSVSNVNGLSEMNSSLNGKTLFLNSFQVNENNMNAKTNKHSFTLNEGVNYQLTASNSKQGVNDGVIMNIYNMNGEKIGSNVNTNTGKIYSKLNFTCASTGTYTVEFEKTNMNSNLNDKNDNAPSVIMGFNV